MLENTKGAMINEQSCETGKTGYTRRRKTTQKHNTICVGHHCTHTNTVNVNRTCALVLSTGGKDEPNIVFMRNSERKDTWVGEIIVFYLARH